MDGRTEEGIRCSSAGSGSRPHVGREGGVEPCRNVTFESMLFSSHSLCSMSQSLLRPAVPLREGIAAIQESGTRTSCLENDTKRSVSVHTQFAETDAASAVQCNLSPFRSAIQLVKVVADFQRVPQVCAIIHPHSE